MLEWLGSLFITVLVFGAVVFLVILPACSSESEQSLESFEDLVEDFEEFSNQDENEKTSFVLQMAEASTVVFFKEKNPVFFNREEGGVEEKGQDGGGRPVYEETSAKINHFAFPEEECKELPCACLCLKERKTTLTKKDEVAKEDSYSVFCQPTKLHCSKLPKNSLAASWALYHEKDSKEERTLLHLTKRGKVVTIETQK